MAGLHFGSRGGGGRPFLLLASDGTLTITSAPAGTTHIIYQPAADDPDDATNVVIVAFTGAPQTIEGVADGEYRVSLIAWSDAEIGAFLLLVEGGGPLLLTEGGSPLLLTESV